MLPPLAPEDHVCPDCQVSYPQTSVAAAVDLIRSLAPAVRQAVAATPGAVLRRRPSPDTWSVTEYVCHLRDVFVTSTIRLYRARTEDGPAVEPMLNDLRARRFRYNERDVTAVLDELAAVTGGFCDEVALTHPDGWDRVVTRLPGEQRTARWLVRQAMHEGLHHLNDIAAAAAAPSQDAD